MRRLFVQCCSALMLLAIGYCASTLYASAGALGASLESQAGGSGAVVVQMSYYAQPGKEQDVLDNRLHACEVLVKNGVTHGRVMTRSDSPRATKNAENPDVVWEGEFPDAASLQRYEDIADKNPDFAAAKQKMTTLTRKTERRYYVVR